MVVMVPLTILNLSFNTRATGARQLVVHEALEMMLSFAATYLSSFTPITMVMSSPVAGAEMMTFLTVPFRCSLACSALVNFPVDSITTCTPRELQSSLAGSRSENTRIFLPSTVMESSVAVMSLDRLPRTESYFSRWASVLGLVRSLTATMSISLSLSAVRRTLRPMRPNPLMPTLIAMSPLKKCGYLLSPMNQNLPEYECLQLL